MKKYIKICQINTKNNVLEELKKLKNYKKLNNLKLFFSIYFIIEYRFILLLNYFLKYNSIHTILDKGLFEVYKLFKKLPYVLE